jgi:DNA-binding NarL/FixJ family response regulator
MLASALMRIAAVIHDSLSGQTIGKAVHRVFPAASFALFDTARESIAALGREPARLVIADAHMPDLDGLDYIPEMISGGLAQDVVIITHGCAQWTLFGLRNVPYLAWIDTSSERGERLEAVLEAARSGRRYTSASIVEALESGSCASSRLLSHREQHVFSLLAEGLDDGEAAQRLSMPVATVRTHRARIMKKLDLHHKGELIHRAHLLGHIRVTHRGVLHPGFDRRG